MRPRMYRKFLEIQCVHQKGPDECDLLQATSKGETHNGISDSHQAHCIDRCSYLSR